MGFTGSTLILLALVIIGLSLFFGFSWLVLCERIGGWLELAYFGIKDWRTAHVDRQAGEVAQARRREQVEAKQDIIVHDQPIRIEPAVVSVVKSERVQKEKQQKGQKVS